MAKATITKKEWGYSLTGGTDATTVLTGNVQLAGVVCTGTASAGTVTVADVAGTTLAKPVFTPSLVEDVTLYDLRAKGLVVTLSATGSVCNIIVK